MDDVMEIEIVPDENMQEPDVEIILGIATSVPESHDANLAEHMSEKDLQISHRICWKILKTTNHPERNG